MPNWAWTQYVVEGPKKTLEKIKHAIQHPDVLEKSSKDWEGNVLRALDIQWDTDKKYLRGFLRQTQWDSSKHTVLRFDAQEAWGATDFNEVLEEHFPDIKVYFNSEEPDMGYYVTNDAEGKYFKDRFYVDAYIKGNYYTEYFIEEKDIWHWLSIWSNGKVTNQEEMKAFNEDTEGNSEDYIGICPFKIVK